MRVCVSRRSFRDAIGGDDGVDRRAFTIPTILMIGAVKKLSVGVSLIAAMQLFGFDLLGFVKAKLVRFKNSIIALLVERTIKNLTKPGGTLLLDSENARGVSTDP